MIDAAATVVRVQVGAKVPKYVVEVVVQTTDVGAVGKTEYGKYIFILAIIGLLFISYLT